MNIERVHAIALSVKKELDSLQVVQLLSQLSSHLQNVVNQPQQPQHQEQVASTKKTILEKLLSAESNEFSPAWIQSIKELGVYPLIGQQLATRIENIFLENQVTPQVALKEIQAITTEVQSMHTSLEHLINGFIFFQIGHEILEPGEGELGILLPRAYIENKFENLAKEFNELNSVFRVLSEVATGSVEDFEIRSLSTTDPFITLAAGLGVLSTFALALKPIISCYKEILEVRLLHAQLAEKKITKKRLKGIEDHAEELMGKTIEKIKKELIASYPVDDNGRKNELSNALGPALKKLANRIDRGFNIEIRVEPIHEAEDADEPTTSEEKEKIQIIQEAMQEMEFMKLEGEPILNLPETTKEK